MTRSQELQEPLGATPAQEAGNLVLRLLGNHERAGNRRKMGFKLKQEANSSKHRLMGENVIAQGGVGAQGHHLAQKWFPKEEMWEPRQEGQARRMSPRQRPGGGKSQPSLVNSTGFRFASGFEGGGGRWDQVKPGLQYQVQGLDSLGRMDWSGRLEAGG